MARILYITSNCPHAPAYGGQIRALNIGRLLQACGDVKIVLLERGDSFSPEAIERTRAEFDLEMVMKLNPRPISGIRERVRHELDARVPNTHGFWPVAAQVSKLKELVAEHDVLWLHNTFVANHAGVCEWPRAILDLDDVLSQYHRSALTTANGWGERARAFRQFVLWKRREGRLLKRFTLLAVCSENDKRYLGGGDRIHTIPNGYGTTAVEPLRRPESPCRLGFIGALDYPPNRDGVEWFIREVWPGLKQTHPDARLRLVGEGTDGDISSTGPDIDGLGRVEDAAAEIASWTMGIVPIRVGGGTRIKIAEGFSRRCPLVSTTLGAFGYDVTTGTELLLADGANDFVRACDSILRNPEFGIRLAESAWQRYRKNWTWSAIRPRVAAALEHCLALSKGECVVGVSKEGAVAAGF